MSSTDKPFGVPGASSEEGPLQSTEASEEEEIKAARAANRFDIRRLIGGLFIVYGLILTAFGIFGSSQVKHKAAGLNVDLWTGIGMLVFGALMVFWALSKPVMPELPEPRGEGAGGSRRSPAT